jgi:hypothetical protein
VEGDHIRDSARATFPLVAPSASEQFYWLRCIASYSNLIASIGANTRAGHGSLAAIGKSQQRTVSRIGRLRRSPGSAPFIW